MQIIADITGRTITTTNQPTMAGAIGAAMCAFVGAGSKICTPFNKKIMKETVKALKGRNAALLANHGAVCIGRDLDETFVACQILEKGCKAFIEAEFLGGAKGISKFESWIMHQVYLKKYSKLAKK
jgi:ribulose-5-phosphate 4-epimerase/fuculose-1-phosphate aldolase